MTRFQQVAGWWRAAGVMLLNALVIFLLLNLVLYAEHHIRHAIKDRHRDPTDNPVIRMYGMDRLRPGYPDLSDAQIQELLDETWTRGFGYEPFTMFKEGLSQGTYVNVDTNGFRLVKDPGPWPPQSTNFNVFVFGGSTMFGYGVADEQTVASRLQEKLRLHPAERRVCVYNLGRGYYNSTQERILFGELLSAGMRPDVAVFVDGLNEFGELAFTARFASVFEEGDPVGPPLGVLQSLPLIEKAARLSRSIAKRRKPKPTEPEPKPGADVAPPLDDQAQRALDRYLRNREMSEAMGAEFGVQTFFYWQPIPFYKYDLSLHPFNPDSESAEYGELVGHAYERFASQLRTNPLPENFVWLADVQESSEQPLYVDQVHYGPALCDVVAEGVATTLAKPKRVP